MLFMEVCTNINFTNINTSCEPIAHNYPVAHIIGWTSLHLELSTVVQERMIDEIKMIALCHFFSMKILKDVFFYTMWVKDQDVGVTGDIYLLLQLWVL